MQKRAFVWGAIVGAGLIGIGCADEGAPAPVAQVEAEGVTTIAAASRSVVTQFFVPPPEGDRTGLGDEIFVGESPRSGLKDPSDAEIRSASIRRVGSKNGCGSKSDFEAGAEVGVIERR